MIELKVAFELGNYSTVETVSNHMNLMKCLVVLICFVSIRYVNAQQSSPAQTLLEERCKIITNYKASLESDLTSRISFRAETYIKKPTGYTPYTYFDTVITATKNILSITPFRLPALMSRFAGKINSLDVSTANNSGRLLSYTLIDSFSRRTFRFPVDIADSMRTGVYASFEEFRNNHPSIFDYDITQGEDSYMTLNLKDEQGNSYYFRKMWGFCDGKQVYVMMDGNLFPLFTYNRAYYIYGSRESLVKKKSGPLLITVPSFLPVPLPGIFRKPQPNDKMVRAMRLFKLDIESGEIY